MMSLEHDSSYLEGRKKISLPPCGVKDGGAASRHECDGLFKQVFLSAEAVAARRDGAETRAAASQV